jgi:hypothetical protein
MLITYSFIHALSIRSLPWESGYSSLLFKFSCLLVPFTGARRGLSAILRCDVLIRDEFEAAGRSGALCMVVRNYKWRPHKGDRISGCSVAYCDGIKELGKKSTGLTLCSLRDKIAEKTNPGKAESAVSITSTELSDQLTIQIKSPYIADQPTTFLGKVFIFLFQSWSSRIRPVEQLVLEHNSVGIYGAHSLTEGYSLCIVPQNVKVYPNWKSPTNSKQTSHIKLNADYSIPRILFAMSQTLVGAVTVYQSRGSQLNTFGYAAFGLTVVPYIVMSIINSFACLVSREYHNLFLVHSDVLDEMLARGGIAEGVIGTVTPPPVEFSTGDMERAMTLVEPHSGIEVGFEGATEDSNEATICTAIFDQETSEKSNRPVGPTFDPWDKKVLGKKALQIEKGFVPWKDYAFQKPHCPSPTDIGQSALIVPSHEPLSLTKQLSVQYILNTIVVFLFVAAVVTPYITIAVLTHFKAGVSNGSQRSYTMTWLVWGMLNSFFIADVEKYSYRKNQYWIILLAFVTYGSNAVGGLVTVAQEMIDFGYCTYI